MREKTYARPEPDPLKDVSATLATMDRCWRDLFSNGPLTRRERGLVIELLHWRNRWAHADPILDADVGRVRLSADELLNAVGRPPARDSGAAGIGAIAARRREPPIEPALAPDSGFRIGPVVASLSETPNELTFEEAQRPFSNYRLVARAHYRTPNYRVPENVRGLLVDQELDIPAVVAEIVNGVEDAVRSGALSKGDRVSPNQVTLPPEANPDLTILAFRNLEQTGVLELERLGVAVWRVL